MREDMFKVIVERPRRGWRSRPHKRGSGAMEVPVKIGVRRHVAQMGIKSKWLNENLNPLRRFLGKQVGRPWDKVYSEIAATLAPGHTVKEHVRQHLDDFVARTVTFDKDGQPVTGNGRRFLSSNFIRQPYYVDPKDGLLKDTAKLWKKLGIDPWAWKRREEEPDPNIRLLEPMRELRRIDGVWYEVLFNRNTLAEEWVFDLLSRTRVPANTRHAVTKRQLSRAELDAFELENIYNE